MLMIVTGKWPGNDPLEIPADQAHSPGTFQRLSNYTLPEIEKKLATYDKLIVVRHPLERLLSAYRNKLEAKHEKSAKYFQSRFGKKIIKVRNNFLNVIVSFNINLDYILYFWRRDFIFHILYVYFPLYICLLFAE